MPFEFELNPLSNGIRNKPTGCGPGRSGNPPTGRSPWAWQITNPKVAALRWASSRPGIKQIYSSNAQVNRGMLAINEALGFVKEPAVI